MAFYPSKYKSYFSIILIYLKVIINDYIYYILLLLKYPSITLSLNKSIHYPIDKYTKIISSNISIYCWKIYPSFTLFQSNLVVLNLSWNKITSISAGTLDGLVNLDYLDLQFNHLDTLEPGNNTYSFLFSKAITEKTDVEKNDRIDAHWDLH